MRKVYIDLGENSYDIFIGHSLDQEMLAFLKKRQYSQKALLISDDHVAPLYGEAVLRVLRKAGLDPLLYVIPSGETSKSLAEAEKIYTQAISWGLDRHSPLLALGGGVVGDLAGFIAATYMRGIPFLQLPTSLLAQVDSSVGGKVAVNHALGKNLIGTFYQPDAVFMDMDRLYTLPKREIATGLGEIIKYGVIDDADFFAFLEENADAILRLDAAAIEHMVARSCEIKAAVVMADEKELGLRRILNFGHTIGHAVEKETNYQKYNHGEAIAIGMMGAAKLSQKLGLADEGEVFRLQCLLQRMQLPCQAAGCCAAAMQEDLVHDKKTVAGQIHWVLMEGIGRVKVQAGVSDALVYEVLQSCLAGM